MIDIIKMKPAEKSDYVFSEGQSKVFPLGRFNWIDCLLGDVQTFLDGIDSYLLSKCPGRGGGNLSVPILLSTALGLVSDLYVGKTDYMERTGDIPERSYRADNNVEQFVAHFFPQNYSKFPLLIWDGVRNGITHLFSPKPFQYQGEIIRFQFSVENKNASSFVTKEGETTFVRINDFELYDVFKKAIENYRQELENDEELQNKFIQAWDSIETYIRRIDTSDKNKFAEAKILVDETRISNNHLVLWEGRPIGNIMVSRPAKPTREIRTVEKGTIIVNSSIANTTLV